jgi:hypothetical protein
LTFFAAGASDVDYRDLLTELDIMSSIEEHPNIINLIGACTQRGKTDSITIIIIVIIIIIIIIIQINMVS